jgi:hypothetical protein
VIWEIIKGFLLSLILSFFIVWIIVTLYFPDDPPIVKDINDKVYFTQTTSGYPTTSPVTEIAVYHKRKWWLDKNIACLTMYEGYQPTEIFL